MDLLSHSGFMLPVKDPEITAKAVTEFLTTPMGWYFHLALRTSEHGRVSLRNIRVPATFVAGRWDVLAGARDMRTAADRIEGATYVELPGSHFLGSAHTLANYETAYYEPTFGDSSSWEQWEDEGALDARQRANADWKRRLADYEQPPMPAGVDEALDEFIAKKKAATEDAWY